jgi:hypothetical protein
MHALTHSLILFFCAAMAVVYDRIGLDAADEEYTAIA